MIVTITADYKKATFTWSDDLMDCDMVAVGFDDSELDAIMEAKGHEGADVEGCLVEIK